MIYTKFRLMVLCTLTMLIVGCRNTTSNETSVPVQQKEGIVPTVCLYTMGTVDRKLRCAMIDSLKAHYPRCKFAGNIGLPDEALTTKRHDHPRYRADLLNKVLGLYKSDSTIVIGLTQADIGLDNFRNRPHSGIMGLAGGFGIGIAVFSSYRPHGYGQLFCVMLHEIGHTQGLRHCKNPHCIMQNGNGGNPFSKTNVFCDKCKDFMQARHWKL